MTTARKGRFITVEGSEGVGKSTNMAFIADYLRTRGKTVVETREPGGSPVAERIRDILLQSEVGSMTDLCELLLMFAARDDHVHKVILPALERGDWVLCDRFIDATHAYQGGGRGMNADKIALLENLVLQGFTPDLTILLEADPAITAARMSGRGRADRFESEQAGFFGRVKQRYAERARAEPERIQCVDASGPLAEVQKTLAAILDKYFKNNSL